MNKNFVDKKSLYTLALSKQNNKAVAKQLIVTFSWLNGFFGKGEGGQNFVLFFVFIRHLIFFVKQNNQIFIVYGYETYP
jgi:hypothetical protein